MVLLSLPLFCKKRQKELKYSEFFRLAQKNGWSFLRQAKGSHEIWTNGIIEVTIPNHGSKEMFKGLEKKLKKQMGM